MRLPVPNNKAAALFLLLSAAAHAAFIHEAYGPVAAVRDAVPPVEVRLIRPAAASAGRQAAAQGEQDGKDTAATAPLAARAAMPSSAKPPDGTPAEDAAPGEVQMLPILQVREWLADRLAGAAFEAGEYRQDPTDDARYYGALNVERRVRAQHDLLPVYPKDAYDANRQGRVIVELLIDAEGGLDAVRILAATPGFDVSAHEALRTMRFAPAERHGEKVASRLLIEMQYLLRRPSAHRSGDDAILPVGTFAQAAQ